VTALAYRARVEPERIVVEKALPVLLEERS